MVTVKCSLENHGDKKTVLKMNWAGLLFIQRKAIVLCCSHKSWQNISVEVVRK